MTHDQVTEPYGGARLYPTVSSLGELLPYWLAQDTSAPAVSFVGGDKWNRSQLAAHIATALAQLDEWGVKPGDHLAIVCDNSPEMVVALLAGISSGAVIVPVNTGLSDEGMGAILRHCDAMLIIAESKYAARCEAQVGETVRVKLVTELMDAPPRDSTLRVAKRSPQDPAMIIYTSGTTGLGKGVVLSHKACLTASAACAGVLFEASSEDRIFTCLPLFHCAAQQEGLWTCLTSGAELVLDSRFRPSEFWDIMARYDVTKFHFIGPMLSALWKETASQETPANHVRVAGGGGPRTVWEEFEKRFNLQLVEFYGMTETFGGCVSHRPGRARPWTLGRAMAHVEVRVVHDNALVGPGTQGEIQIRPVTPGAMFDGYYKDAQRTEAAWQDGWYRTGDLGSWTQDGFLVYHSRLDDVIRHRGENISAVELEKTFSELPGVLECAIVGVESELGDQDILAAVVPETGTVLNVEDFWRACEQVAPKYAIPRYVLAMEQLPKTATHRLQRHLIRARVSEALERQR